MTGITVAPKKNSKLSHGLTTHAAGREKLSFVTHGDLLRLAQREHCRGIATEPVLPLCRPEKNFWVFKATVFKSSPSVFDEQSSFGIVCKFLHKTARSVSLRTARQPGFADQIL